jgi:8-oxo-dGTP diphosphatase
MNFKHRIRLTGLVYEQDRVLLVQHINPRTGIKRWSTPGGGLELSDPDIFRGVEREILEETGLLVSAGKIQFMNEFFDIYNNILMIDIWIQCHPLTGDRFGPINMDNIREDDYIIDVKWWNKTDFLSANHHANAPLLKEDFWDNLGVYKGDIVHLGRWEE